MPVLEHALSVKRNREDDVELASASVIESAGYFGKIGALLEAVPKRVLANYLVLRHVLDLSGATTETMRRLQGWTEHAPQL